MPPRGTKHVAIFTSSNHVVLCFQPCQSTGHWRAFGKRDWARCGHVTSALFFFLLLNRARRRITSAPPRLRPRPSGIRVCAGAGAVVGNGRGRRRTWEVRPCKDGVEWWRLCDEKASTRGCHVESNFPSVFVPVWDSYPLRTRPSSPRTPAGVHVGTSIALIPERGGGGAGKRVLGNQWREGRTAWDGGEGIVCGAEGLWGVPSAHLNPHPDLQEFFFRLGDLRV